MLTICAIFLDDENVLLVKKTNNIGWNLPGGKPKPGESDRDCLSREIKEEFSGTRIKNLRHYHTAHLDSDQERFTLRAYLVTAVGEVGPHSGEVQQSAWVNEVHNYALGDLTLRVINELRREEYL